MGECGLSFSVKPLLLVDFGSWPTIEILVDSEASGSYYVLKWNIGPVFADPAEFQVTRHLIKVALI